MSKPSALFVARIGKTPALLMRPAIGRWSAMISAAARRALAMSDRSHTTETACRPFCSMVFCTSPSFWRSRPTSTTAPCSASSSAVRRPMPEVGPVMMYAFRSDALFRSVPGIFASACLSSQSFIGQKIRLRCATEPRTQPCRGCLRWPARGSEVDGRFRQRAHQGGRRQSVASFEVLRAFVTARRKRRPE